MRGLCSGSYTVTATNEFGCSATQTFDLCCAGIELGTITNATPGGARGSVEYELLHDVPITRLTLNGSPISLNTNLNGLTNLAPGDYTISFETVPGCTAFAHFTISECEDLGPDTSETLPSTSSTCGTTVDVSMDDPLRFTYVWQDGDTRRYRSLNCGSEYSVTITDSRGCGSLTRNFTVCSESNPEIFDLEEFTVENEVITATGGITGNVILELPFDFDRIEYVSLDNAYGFLQNQNDQEVEFVDLQEDKFEIIQLHVGKSLLRFVKDGSCDKLGEIIILKCPSLFVIENLLIVGELGDISSVNLSYETPCRQGDAP